MDLATLVYDQWFDLRAKNRLDGVLPRARSFRSLRESGEIWGYETHEHRVRRRVSVPGSGPAGGDGVAGLIETYFSERLDDGGIGWALNLHVHVVEVENETAQVPHVAQLVRNVAAIRRALRGIGVWDEDRVVDRRVYVHGALLARVVSGDAVMASAFTQDDLLSCTPRISVGCVTVHRSKGILVERVEPRGYYSPTHDDGAEEAKCEIDELLGPTPMLSEWVRARKAEQHARR